MTDKAPTRRSSQWPWWLVLLGILIALAFAASVLVCGAFK